LQSAFGFVLFVSTLRFMARGWIETFYIAPQFHFSFFAWARPLSTGGMWAIFSVMAVAALWITFGWQTKPALAIFFLLFTYVELLDKTYYLNHYYFVSSLCFLLFWLPNTPRSIFLTRFYLALVYFFAGVAKLNSDWLLHAQPLRIWLPANAHLPLIGWLFDYTWVAYLFSWSGALFDLTIGYCLFNRRTRPYAFVALVVFHLLTGWLFPIGMFPYIMIACSLVFFDWGVATPRLSELAEGWRKPLPSPRTIIITLFFIVQIAMPLRHVAYTGDANWTGAGERFAWRVMVADKVGMAFFELTERETGRQFSADPHQFLTPQQVMQMSFQPDMLVQFARFLGETYAAEVRVEAFVSVNGRPARLLLDPTLDLTQQ
jgi:hypothetical protein